MKHNYSDLLISYLFNELTDTENLQLEQRISSDPALSMELQILTSSINYLRLEKMEVSSSLVNRVIGVLHKDSPAIQD